MTVALVEIIKACKKAGVLRLKYKELEIELSPGDAADLSRVQTPEVVVPPTDEELKIAETAADDQSFREAQDDDLALMQIEDPARFEELLINREFNLGEEAENDR